MSKKIAVFPGSFDPITLGHYHLVLQGLALFDEIIVAVGENIHKKYFFTLTERLAFIKEAFADFPTVRIGHYTGTTLDFCVAEKASFILRGLRNAQDFEMEKNLSLLNQYLIAEEKPPILIQSVFLMPPKDTAWISSTMVKELLKYKKDASGLLPNSKKNKK